DRSDQIVYRRIPARHDEVGHRGSGGHAFPVCPKSGVRKILHDTALNPDLTLNGDSLAGKGRDLAVHESRIAHDGHPLVENLVADDPPAAPPRQKGAALLG